MMGAAKTIKVLLKVRDMTITDFADLHGNPVQSMRNKLYRDTMSFSEVEAMADELDFDIVFKDRKTGKEY